MKLEERQVELIQAEVDGELASTDRAEFRDDLRAVCTALDSIQPEEPPAGLREQILTALPPGSRTTAWGRGRTLLSSPARLRYAAAFAGGLLVSALALQFGTTFRHGEASVDELVGTMARATPEAVGPGIDARAVDSASIDVPNVTGAVSLHGTTAAPVIGVLVLARADVQVVARLEGQEIRFGGFNPGAQEPDVRVGAFRHEGRGPTSQVDFQVIDTATGNVLQSSTLKFDTTR
jgi:hypothetical protein